MKSRFRFTVKLKLIIGFGLLSVLILSMYRFINNRQADSNLRIKQNIELYAPSLQYTTQLKELVMKSQALIQKWVLAADSRNIKLKNDIDACHTALYDSLKSQIVYFVDKDLWNDKSKDLYFKTTTVIDTLFSLQQDLLDNLHTAQDFADLTNYSFMKYNVLEGDIYTTYRRAQSNADNLNDIFYKTTNENIISIDENFTESNNLIKYSILGFFVVMLIVAFILSNSLLGSLNYIKNIIIKISEGALPEVSLKRSNDEIGEMSEALKLLVFNLKETSQFALKIGEGNFSSEFKPQSKNDVLGNSLLVMRQNLIKADQEAEQRKIENAQRNWSSQGLAEFNELLRNAGDDMQLLSNKVIEKLVRYLDANMGGIYIVNDENPEDIHLELTAFYAYDRLKYIKKRIEIGENLIGQCFQENETIYLTELQEGYVHISSGLGESDPNCLVIVPLKVNAETYGIVELASFQVIEKYQVEFIEKIGETIASTISSVKINMNTAKLLEESHEKSKMLSQQEAEVHKNIESLKAQIVNLEEINKRDSVKYQKLHDDYENQAESHQSAMQKQKEKNDQLQDTIKQNTFILNNSTGYYELDGQGFYVSANQRYLNDIDMPLNAITEKDIKSFMATKDEQERHLENMKKFAEGLSFSGVTKYTMNGKIVYMNETFTPIRDSYNMLVKIAVVAANVSTMYNNNLDLSRQVEDLKNEIEILKARLG